MATAYKVLGQSKPAAGTLTTLYTVPASTQAVISSLTIANMGPTSTTYRLAIRAAGAAISFEDYIAYDVLIPTLPEFDIINLSVLFVLNIILLLPVTLNEIL